MAAALAYRTIFSLIPTLAIGLLIVGSVATEEQIDAGVRRMMEFAGISQIAVSSDDAALTSGRERSDGGASGADAQDPEVAEWLLGADPDEEAGDATQAAGPAGTASNAGSAEGPASAGAGADQAVAGSGPDSAEVEEIITGLVARVNTTLNNLPAGWIALVTGLVLLYAAVSMLVEVEKSFNHVCAAPHGRSWPRRLILYWTMLTLGGVLLAATFWVSDRLAQFVYGSGGSAVRGLIAGYGVSVLISTVLLTVAYMAIPTVRLRFRSVIAGAFIAAIAWELGKWGFTSYLRYSTGYARLYGSLALLPLFMLWVYVTWVIVLLGLQAAYTLQHFSSLMAADPGGDEPGPRLIDPTTVISLDAALFRAHRNGESPDAGELGAMVGIEAAVVETLLRRLEAAGLARRVAGGDEDECGWVPARPAERVRVTEVLDAVRDLDAARWPTDCAGVLGELAEARRRALADRTMREVLPDADRPADGSPPPDGAGGCASDAGATGTP
jgi:membrane protein